MDRARPGVRFALYAAAMSGTVVSALFLLSVVPHRDEPDVVGRAVYWSLALVFYAGLAVFSGGLCRAEARRAWMAACAFISLAVAVLGGGPGGVALSALSALPIAILMWLAVRGKLW
jgi:hypothetical protein